jgi:hypothetical protein
VEKLMITVKLDDIVNQLEVANHDGNSYLNIATGEIVFVPEEDMIYAEESTYIDDMLPEWHQKVIVAAKHILVSDDFLIFPSKFELNEYKMMEKFCHDIQHESLKEVMVDAIKGKGAFSRFKMYAERFNILDDWYEYRRDRYREIAEEWCKENGLSYT